MAEKGVPRPACPTETATAKSATT